MSQVRVLEVEALTPDNINDLVEMFGAVDRSHFPHATAEAATQFLRQPNDIFVLGRADGVVVAFGMLRGWHDGYEVPSLGIAVRGDAASRGYGRAMMQSLAELARTRGAHRIRLRVHPENRRAQRLYRSCGYRAAGLDRGEMLMFLELS